jgi:hypothetical protein
MELNNIISVGGSGAFVGFLAENQGVKLMTDTIGVTDPVTASLIGAGVGVALSVVVLPELMED